MQIFEKTNSMKTDILNFLALMGMGAEAKVDTESVERSATPAPTPDSAETTTTTAAKTASKNKEQSIKGKQQHENERSDSGMKKSQEDKIAENEREKVKKESTLNTNNLVKKEEKYFQDLFTVPGADNTKRKRVYLTHIFAGVVFMVFFVNRLVFSSFCHFDDEAYIIHHHHDYPQIGNIDSSPISPINNNGNNGEKTSDHQLTTSTSISPFKYDDRKSQSYQSMCQSSHSVLDYLALIFHPFIDYHTIVPKTRIITKIQPQISAAGAETISLAPITNSQPSNNGIIQYDKRGRRRVVINPVQVLVQACQNIFKSFTNLFKIIKIETNDHNDQLDDNDELVELQDKAKNESNNGGNSIDSSGNNNDGDLTMYVSVPLQLKLSPEQEKILEKTRSKLLERLQKEEEEGKSSDSGKTRLERAFWGGSGKNGFRWWAPTRSRNDDTNGTSILAAYLKIMKWPKVRV